MKILTKFMLPLTAALMLLGCAKEQSSLTISDIEGEATITGCLTYTTGQSYENGTSVENFAPASKVRVQVKVQNSDLDPSGNADGYTVYETTTDNEGNYSVSIPALDQGVTAVVKAQSFTGKRTFVNGFDATNNVLISEKDVVYETGNTTLNSVEPGDIKVCDIMYGYKERGSAEIFDEIGVLHGKVGVGQFYQLTYSDFERNEYGEIAWRTPSYSTEYGGYEVGDSYYDYYQNDLNYTPRTKNRKKVEPYWEETEGINVLVTVTYPTGYTDIINGAEVSMTRTFGATTDRDGKFKVNIPIREKGITFRNVLIDPVAYIESDYTNYYQENPSPYYVDYNKVEFLEGVVSLVSGSQSGTSYEISKLEGVYDEMSVRMVFKPLDRQDHHYDGSGFNSSTPWGTDSF